MKKCNALVAVILVLVMAFGMVTDTVALAANSTMQGAIAVSNAQQLDNIRNNLSGNFYLTQDVDVSTLGFNWTPIGTREAPFTGTFDGHGFQITNMRVGNTYEERDDQGLFGVISGATVRNFTVNGMVIGRNYVGGVAGRVANGSLIENVTNNADIYGAWNVGGVTGFAINGIIIDRSANKANINGRIHVGGIVGFAGNGNVIRQSFNTGDISASYQGVGGIVGTSSRGIIISNVYNIGNIIATGYGSDDGEFVHYPGGRPGGRSVGGIIGNLSASEARNTIEFTYNAGDVVAVPGPLVENYFYRGLMLPIGGTHVGGVIGGTGNLVSDSVVRFNVVLSNSIHGRDMIIAETITGQQNAIVAGFVFGLISGEAALSVDEQLTRIINNNFAAAHILGNAHNDAETTLPMSAFLQQSTWESIGFDFENVWFMPEGENALPALQWQTDNFPVNTVPVWNSVIEYAQWLFEYLETGKGMGTFNGWAQSMSARRHGLYQNMTGAAHVSNMQQMAVDISSLTLSFVVAGIKAKANPADTVSAITSYAYDMARFTLSELDIFSAPWDGNETDWVFATALRGNRDALALGRFIDLHYQILDDRNGQVVDLGMALDYITTYYRIEMGMSSLSMGERFFADTLRTSRIENIGQILANVALGLFADVVTDGVGSDVTNWFVGTAASEALDALANASEIAWAGVTNTHIRTWRQEQNRIMQEMNRWRHLAPSTPTISTTPRPADLPSHWAVEQVSAAITAGIVPRNLQSNYTQATTRAEFAALAVALYETVTGHEITGRMTFNDTNDINVQKMGYLGVVTGVGDGNFAPNAQLTREQAAILITRLAATMGQPFPQSSPTFADNAQISDWALDGVGQLQASGIMGGVGNNMFSPDGSFTREQSIIAMLRLFDMV